MYNNWVYNRLNEAMGYDIAYSNADAIEKLGEVDVYDESTNSFKKMKPGELIKVVADALYRMQRDYPYLYQFLSKCRVMYIPVFPSQITDTMAVDADSNLWINFKFIYNECKMSSDRAFGILFHEMFHIFFEHCFRFDKKYPREMFKGQDMGKNSPYGRANMKANLCMDYEVNSSMVEDGIVTADFFKLMNGLYKKEYTGMTWEEILDKYGNKEYEEWLSRNGMSLDNVEMKVLEAIEKASKVLMDPDADEDEKRDARKQLKKDLEKILGKDDKNGEKSLQDIMEELQNSKLGDTSSIAREMDDIIDDLHRDPAGMDGVELEKTLDDMKRLADDMMANADEIGRDFNKSMEEVQNDVKKAQEAFNDAMKQINEGNLSKDERQDLLDAAKDAMEDIIADETEKEKLKKKRDERDAKKAAERKERFKRNHPIQKLIKIMKNLIDLKSFGLVSEDTQTSLGNCITEMDELTNYKFDEMKKSMLKKLSGYLDESKDALYKDLVELLNNDTILNKTEEDMQNLVDKVYEYVFDAFRKIFDATISDNDKASYFSLAAQKLRIIGKVLKTQKLWKVGDDFKEAYKEEMKRLMELMKTGGEEALFKELLDAGAIEPIYLDENGKKIYSKLTGIGIAREGVDEEAAEEERKKSAFEGIDPYDGTLYFEVTKDTEYGDGNMTIIMLSSKPGVLSDDPDVYVHFGAKFENDFPEYKLFESMESIWDVCVKKDYEEKDEYVCPEPDELEKKLLDKGYLKGDWSNPDEW